MTNVAMSDPLPAQLAPFRFDAWGMWVRVRDGVVECGPQSVDGSLPGDGEWGAPDGEPGDEDLAVVLDLAVRLHLAIQRAEAHER